MRRRLGAIVLLLLIGSAGGACGNPEREAIDELRRAIAKTERASRRFEYREKLNDGTETAVVGVVEDDFRYKARMAINGKTVLEEVVRDDALADRFIDPAQLTKFAKRDAPSASRAPEGYASAGEVRQSIESGRWILDPAGAPSLLPTGSERRLMGDDPIYDAHRVFAYIDSVARQMGVTKFDEDDLDYKPREDPFPKPKDDGPVARYDFRPYPVPKPADAGGGSNQSVPGEVHFRKMSVYVRDGVIIRVLEIIDVAGRLDDIERNYDIEFTGSTQERVKSAVDAINVVRRGQGTTDPLRVREMSLEISDVGRPLSVDLPADVVTGDLSFLVNRGRVKTTAANLAPGANTAAAEG